MEIWIRRLSILALLGALVIAIACGPRTRVTRFSTHPPQPVDHEIDVYASAVPARAYEEIGLVSASKNLHDSMDDLLAAMKEEARKMGGDAIVDLEDVREAEKPTLSGTVVRYVPEADATPGERGVD